MKLSSFLSLGFVTLAAPAVMAQSVAALLAHADMNPQIAQESPQPEAREKREPTWQAK